MITNVSEFVKCTFIRLVQSHEIEAHGHRLMSTFADDPDHSWIVKIDDGPWMYAIAAQRKFARIIREDVKAEKRIKAEDERINAEYMAERKLGA